MKHSKRASLEGIGLQFFAMGNLDAIQQKRTDILQRMTEAVQANDREKFTQAFSDLADAVGESILGDVRALRDAQDENILAARGCRVLTSQERQYYEAVIGAMKSDDPKQALTNINKVLPETVIDAVFEDLVTSHPLLAEIDFRNTGALVKILLSTTGGAAKWGPLGKTITAELSANFIELDLSLASLTAFLPVNRYMLDLGPAWLDRYVRELLSEALAVELETGIISGNGKDAPIGMCPTGGESGGLLHQGVPRHHGPGGGRDLQQGRVPLPHHGGAVGGGARREGGHGRQSRALERGGYRVSHLCQFLHSAASHLRSRDAHQWLSVPPVK